MSVEENKSIVRRLIDAWNEHDLEASSELHDASKFVSHWPEGWESGPGLSGGGLRTMLTAFPDVRFQIVDVIAEGDKVVLRVDWTGTFTGGEYAGIAPTGKQVTARNMRIYRIEAGKIIEAWVSYDMLSLLLNLGAGREGLLKQIERYGDWTPSR